MVDEQGVFSGRERSRGSVVEEQRFRGREAEVQWQRSRGSVVKEQRLSGGGGFSG